MAINLSMQFNPLPSYATQSSLHSVATNIDRDQRIHKNSVIFEMTSETTLAACPVPVVYSSLQSCDIVGPLYNFCTHLCRQSTGPTSTSLPPTLCRPQVMTGNAYYLAKVIIKQPVLYEVKTI